MSFNLYSLIIRVANENGQDINLEQIGKVNDTINNLLAKGINKNWILNNLECLL